MYQEFDRLSGYAKIWIYNAGRPLTENESDLVMREAVTFCTRWKAHGNPLKCSAKIFHDQFLVLAVDESSYPVSGCSIDESIHFVRELSELLRIDFLNRDLVSFYNRGNVFSLNLKEAREKTEKGEIAAEQLVFNNTLSTKSELETNWIVPVRESWLKNRLPKKAEL